MNIIQVLSLVLIAAIALFFPQGVQVNIERILEITRVYWGVSQ